VNFKNKIIIITGGSSGIGAATVKLFHQKGAIVYILDKKKPDFLPIESIKYLSCDVAKSQQVKAAIEVILAKNPRIDFLFCNAAIHLFANIEESSVQAMHDVLAVNVLGTIYCIQHILPTMKQQKFGSIVLMASDQAFIAKEQCAIYGASKAAIAQLAKSTALDYAAYNIRVNCICPGTIDTPMYHQVIQQFQEKTRLSAQEIHEEVIAQLPLKRVGKPEEIASVVAFLCGEGASFMTGALVAVDGGYTIR
jgi:NAD(P)-dependent dehydrogenase (short-subunit alcohol dehydrogenase family)